MICEETGCAQTAGGTGFILCLCGAFSAPLLCGDPARYPRSNRAEYLLIYRIPSHTNPKRRDFSLKQPGQKSAKEEGPEQRKGPKRAVNGSLKVQTHVWEHDAVGSSPATPTSFPGKAACSGGLFVFWGSFRRLQTGSALRQKKSERDEIHVNRKQPKPTNPYPLPPLRRPSVSAYRIGLINCPCRRSAPPQILSLHSKPILSKQEKSKVSSAAEKPFYVIIHYKRNEIIRR